MGKSDIAMRNFMQSRERFADMYNANIFEGRQIVKAEDLVLLDGESGDVVSDKDNREKQVYRYRDVAMLWKQEIRLAILAIENQDRVHYAMPVRNMLYDSLSYMDQVKEIWKKHLKNKDTGDRDEFISKFKKGDKIYPVVTLVFYYGEKPWDGCTDLYGMLYENSDTASKKVLQKYIPNYHINLIDAQRLENIALFQTDLQLLLGMLKYRSRKKELLQYVNRHRDYFGRLDQDTYQAVQAFLNSRRLMRKVLPENREEEIDMCKALEDLYADGKEEGRELKGAEVIRKMLNKGCNPEFISDVVDMPIDAVRRIQTANMNKI